MKKSIFEKLGLVEVEESYDDIISESYACEESSVDSDITVDGEVENMINEIYSNANLEDKSQSVYKVADLIATLPAETPKKTVKQIVNNLLNTLNIPAANIREDADKRIEAIGIATNNKLNENKGTVADCEARIEEAKELIENLTAKIQSCDVESKRVSQIASEEINKIDELLQVIEEEVTDNASK